MLAYTLRLLRCWRLVTLNDTLHDHVNTFFSVVPVFAQTLSFALIMAYFFAMVAMQAFADKVMTIIGRVYGKIHCIYKREKRAKFSPAKDVLYT